jgi:hypothetical protein
MAAVEGVWGAVGANLAVGHSALNLEMGCGEATIPGVVTFDANGHFEVQGSFMETGPIRAGGNPSTPATFIGQLHGDELDLTIRFSGDESIGTYQFHYGQTQMFARCL